MSDKRERKIYSHKEIVALKIFKDLREIYEKKQKTKSTSIGICVIFNMLRELSRGSASWWSTYCTSLTA